ncbi:hypothetical protein MLD38_006600 [Melastoma candidum]|uniref:Uncharacterized protein n=1 Tax=Melastoma candidum TaxID=119954 RepID=A0ACB9RS60_9MYRT|nr:hypothetical protein MLD38_006600 [Melastoma candidum]
MKKLFLLLIVLIFVVCALDCPAPVEARELLEDNSGGVTMGATQRPGVASASLIIRPPGIPRPITKPPGGFCRKCIRKPTPKTPAGFCSKCKQFCPPRVQRPPKLLVQLCGQCHKSCPQQ